MFPIIDTHQHLWDLTRFQLPWLKSDSPLNKSYLPTDYDKAISEISSSSQPKADVTWKVVKSVYMEVDVDPSQQDQEAEYVIGLCKIGKTPMVAAVISGRPASEGFKAYITKYKDNAYIKGVRQVLHGDGTKPGYCLQPSFVKNIQLLGELGKSYDLCVRAAEIPDAVKLVDACPGTRFILDHCGNANVQAKDHSQWKKDMAAIAQRKNVVGKVSGIVASAKPAAWSADDLAPIVNHTVDVFGKNRVMFGGDWPVCTLTASYRQWVDALRTIVADWKEDDQRMLFHDNAMRFYGLS